MILRATLAVLAALVCAGCTRDHELELSVPAGTPDDLEWTVSFYATDEACAAEPATWTPAADLAHRQTFAGARGTSVGALGEGRYAVVAVARDTSCQVALRGCASVSLGAVGAVRVETSAPPGVIACGATEACMARRCVPGMGTDAAVDGSADAAVDASADAGTRALPVCTPVTVVDESVDGPLADHFALATDGAHVVVALALGAVGGESVVVRRVPRLDSASPRADLDLSALRGAAPSPVEVALRAGDDGAVSVVVAHRFVASPPAAVAFGRAGSLDLASGAFDSLETLATSADRVIPRLAVAGGRAGEPIRFYWLEDRDSTIAYAWHQRGASGNQTAALVVDGDGRGLAGAFGEAVGSGGRFIAWTGGPDILGFVDAGATDPLPRACDYAFLPASPPAGAVLGCSRANGSADAFASRTVRGGSAWDRTGWAWVGGDAYVAVHPGPSPCSCLSARASVSCASATCALGAATTIATEGRPALVSVALGTSGPVLTYTLGDASSPFRAVIERHDGSLSGATAFRQDVPTSAPSLPIQDVQLAVTPDGRSALVAVLRASPARLELVEVPLDTGCP